MNNNKMLRMIVVDVFFVKNNFEFIFELLIYNDYYTVEFEKFRKLNIYLIYFYLNIVKLA